MRSTAAKHLCNIFILHVTVATNLKIKSHVNVASLPRNAPGTRRQYIVSTIGTHILLFLSKHATHGRQENMRDGAKLYAQHAE